MQIETYTKTGNKAESKVTLNQSVFGAKINKDLLNQAVFVYLSNQRQSNAQTKDRGEVSGGGRKPWRQKGTGRARHGSNRSPIWKGGGATFGPDNTRNYKKQLSKNMRKSAMRAAFSYQASLNQVKVFEELDFTGTKLTQSLQKVLDKAGVKGKTLIITAEKSTNLLRAANNLPNVKVDFTGELNVYQLLNAVNVVIVKDALESINKAWAVEKAAVKPEKTEEKVEKKTVSTKAALKPVKAKAATSKKTTAKPKK